MNTFRLIVEQIRPVQWVENVFVLSVRPVIFGVARYIHLVHERMYRVNPTNVASNDRPLRVNLLV